MTSDFTGNFALANGQLALTPLRFDVPGALVEVSGGYGLRSGCAVVRGTRADGREDFGSGWRLESHLAQALRPALQAQRPDVHPGLDQRNAKRSEVRPRSAPRLQQGRAAVAATATATATPVAQSLSVKPRTSLQPAVAAIGEPARNRDRPPPRASRTIASGPFASDASVRE